MTLKMTTAQVVETSVTVTNSSFQNYTHPDDHTTRTRWIDVNKSKVIKLLEKKDTNQGFIFEVDLDYPDTLWESHNDYALAPEKLKVDKIDKLICSFIPKRHYVVHYKNLKQYLEERMILKKVHRGIKFYQSPWMEPYIRKNTDLRKLANNAFEKDFSSC